MPGDIISCADIIVEDDGAGWTQSPGPNDDGCAGSVNSWARCEHGNGYRYHWTYVADPADYWVKWAPSLRYRSYYKVYAFVPGDDAANSNTTNARYQHSDGTTTQINQSTNKNWVSLGRHQLYPGSGHVKLSDYTGEASNTRHIAADAMKFSANVTHLPTVQNLGGRVSSIIIRNPSGAASVYVMMRYYTTGGGLVDSPPAVTIAANGATVKTPPGEFSGPAVVVADGDVAVLVREQDSGDLGEYNGSVSTGGFPGWEQAGTVLYAPKVKKSWSGRSSRLLMTNAGAAATNATVQLYRADGTVAASPSFAVPVNGQVNLAFDNYCAEPNGCMWSARISSDNSQALAVVVLERDDAMTSNRHRTIYNAFSAGATSNYAPIVKKNYDSQTTLLSVQNVGAAATNITANCYPTEAGQPDVQCGQVNGVAPGASVVFDMAQAAGLPGGFVGSAVVSSSGEPLATLINETNPSSKKATPAAVGGSQTAYAPEVYGDYTPVPGGPLWDSNISIQNLSANEAHVTVTYYDQAGAPVGAQQVCTIASNRRCVFSYPDDNFFGSALIQADQPIAGLVNTTQTGGGDKASYSLPNR